MVGYGAEEKAVDVAGGGGGDAVEERGECGARDVDFPDWVVVHCDARCS